jgi:Uma2 family endonuclease
MQQLEERVLYPSGDGEPVAETEVHLWAIVTTLEVLRVYIKALAQEQGIPPEREGTVLANQFLFYEEGKGTRVAPDVMVIPNVPNRDVTGFRLRYKTWEEGEVPSVVFEMTSEGTRERDQQEKKDTYEKLGVLEYWLFDPLGEWIQKQLIGYRLEQGKYVPITDSCSTVLNLRLVIEKLKKGSLINFYRLDTGRKLLTLDEAEQRLDEAEQRSFLEKQARQEAEQRADEADRIAKALRARLLALGLDPDVP